MMNRTSLVSLAFAIAAVPVFAQSPAVSLPELLEQSVVSSPSVSVVERAAAFPALAALPVDSDSFLAVGRLGELAALAAGTDAMEALPMLALAEGLESFALGVSADAARDLQRLAPLLELLSASHPGWQEAWLNQAEPAAALAIAAQQREDAARSAEELVEYTRDFRMAPIYMVLTAKPEMQMLLHQASMLPLMIPVDPGGPVELTAQGAWRGFCIKGNLVDLSDSGLSPALESQLKVNLEKVRVYVMARVVENKLVLAITSDMSMVKLPSSLDKSLLASDKIRSFDGGMRKSPWAVCHTSPELVNLSEQLDSDGYRSVAGFVGSVLRRAGKLDERCARAAVALDSLVQGLGSLVPPCRHAEKLMVWQEGTLFVHSVTDARGHCFEPGEISRQSYTASGDCILYMESTPFQSDPQVMPAIPSMLDNLRTVLNGCKATLRPEHAADIEEQLNKLEQARPGITKVSEWLSQLGSSLKGNVTLLVQETEEGAYCPVRFSLRAGVADSVALDAAGPLLQEGVQSLCAGENWSGMQLEIKKTDTALLLATSPGGLEIAPAESRTMQGGMVFSLQLAPLSRAVERIDKFHPGNPEMLKVLKAVASLVERVDGASSIRDGMIHSLLRVQPAGQ